MKKLLSLILCLALLFALLTVGASAYNVVLSPQNLMVNGQHYDCEKYNIDGSNYFKLRDIAYLLMGTDAEFGVGYDEVARSIIVVPGMPYEPVGGELIVGEDKSASAVPSTQSLWFLDASADGLSVYNIGGNNFFKLRDLGTLIGFSVDYDSDTNTAIVRTGDYSEAPAVYEEQVAAFDKIWDWVDANSNQDTGIGKEYIETIDFDNGESGVYELIDTEPVEGLKVLLLVSTYYYQDGSFDESWIYLERGTRPYICFYYYYDVGSDGTGEPDFSADIDLDPATFTGLVPLTFSETGGPLADSDYPFGEWSAVGFADTLGWFNYLLAGTEFSADVSIQDFGFTPDAIES